MKKIIAVFYIILIILILNSSIVKSSTGDMTGYEKGTFITEIKLLNSNGNNKITAWRKNYNERPKYYRSEKQIEEYKKNLEIKNWFINNNVCKYEEEINMYSFSLPYIEITRNNGEIDSFSYAASEIMLRKGIPMYLSYDCEKGIFIDNTDYNKVEKIKQREEIIDKILEFKFIIIIRNCSYYINQYSNSKK